MAHIRQVRLVDFPKHIQPATGAIKKRNMKRITRRTVLKGVGATIALPWLEAMASTSSSLAEENSAVAGGPKRLAFMYTPNGVIGEKWFPGGTSGKDFEWTESLQPLADLRNDVSIISGLNRTYISGEPHSQAASCWMTSALPTERQDGATAINKTLDQIIAGQVGQQTTFRSLELSCNSFVDNMEPKLFDAISWYGPGNDAKSENDPRRVFARLFGKSDRFDHSVLDSVLDEANRLNTRLGTRDRQKLDEYFESVRSIETRLVKQEVSRGRMPVVKLKMPDEVPANRGEYIRMMGDLMILALQTDQTRVATFMVGPERWETPQMYDGVFDKPVNHHQMTHDDAFDDMVAKIDRFHVQQYAYLVNRLKQEREGEGTLLDSCFFVLGSGIGDGNSHSYKQLPMVIAGGGGEQIEGGRHIVCPDGTPLANLWLTLARKMGVNLDRFADSTQPLDEFVA
jgi:hypothetical protein